MVITYWQSLGISKELLGKKLMLARDKKHYLCGMHSSSARDTWLKEYLLRDGAVDSEIIVEFTALEAWDAGAAKGRAVLGRMTDLYVADALLRYGGGASVEGLAAFFEGRNTWGIDIFGRTVEGLGAGEVLPVLPPGRGHDGVAHRRMDSMSNGGGGGPPAQLPIGSPLGGGGSGTNLGSGQCFVEVMAHSHNTECEGGNAFTNPLLPLALDSENAGKTAPNEGDDTTNAADSDSDSDSDCACSEPASTPGTDDHRAETYANNAKVGSDAATMGSLFAGIGAAAAKVGAGAVGAIVGGVGTGLVIIGGVIWVTNGLAQSNLRREATPNTPTPPSGPAQLCAPMLATTNPVPFRSPTLGAGFNLNELDVFEACSGSCRKPGACTGLKEPIDCTFNPRALDFVACASRLQRDNPGMPRDALERKMCDRVMCMEGFPTVSGDGCTCGDPRQGFGGGLRINPCWYAFCDEDFIGWGLRQFRKQAFQRLGKFGMRHKRP